ncbi:calcium/sodium antiporter [Desulfosoma caldarium]|uniref:Cation:H+ antiporter n=1 Tax=Desulfosoma caldarium TaxID=610254 RepID=A0A3N1UR74_9BACT|nr:calcium/sodium antiporter [Desulfosoma caldarium]ROQ93584.1 cation:H+ antiporter [Desulfosoma caldarium]
MLVHVMAVLGGIVALVWGADRFVDGAAALARRLGVSPIIIGLTVVSLGTSLPELLVSLTATVMGYPDVAVGNVLGSNIANIGLILGVASLFRPLMVHGSIVRREYPLLIGVSVIAWLMARNGIFSRFEGFLLTAGLVLFVAKEIAEAKHAAPDVLLQQAAAEKTLLEQTPPLGRSLFSLVAGFVTLTAGSRFLVWGGVALARGFGVSELVIGLTLVAFGTSLPELATSVVGTIKKQDDIAVGNVVGSNLFNTLGILGIPAMVRPLTVSSEAFHRDFPVMLLATLALWPVCRSWSGRQGRVNRLEGGALALGYFVYVGFLLNSRG